MPRTPLHCQAARHHWAWSPLPDNRGLRRAAGCPQSVAFEDHSGGQRRTYAPGRGKPEQRPSRSGQLRPSPEMLTASTRMWTYHAPMRPEPGQVLHFSEDPTITRFVPRVSPTSKDHGAFVWAVDAVRAPDYWFPKQCPRAMAWATPDTSPSDRERIIGPGGVIGYTRSSTTGWRRSETFASTPIGSTPRLSAPSGGPSRAPTSRRNPSSRWGRPSPSVTSWPCTPRPASSCGFWTSCGRTGRPSPPAPAVSTASGCATHTDTQLIGLRPGRESSWAKRPLVGPMWNSNEGSAQDSARSRRPN